jgi:type IV secretion system protein VirB9
MVRWRYPATGMPNTYIGSPEDAGNETPGTEPVTLDPRFMSFNYRVTYGFFRKPKWLPDLVYDDGKKTYIVFPEDVLRGELPALFENRNDIINYRVVGNLLIIDKLILKITVKLENNQVLVEKKRG